MATHARGMTSRARVVRRTPALVSSTNARGRSHRARARGRAAIAALTPQDAAKAYGEVTTKIPPLLTASAVPVVVLSLTCKAITGHGLPGFFLGSVEGVAWLALALGAGALAPKVQELARSGDFTSANVLKVLSEPGRAYGGFGEDSRGKNATERLNSIAGSVDPNSPLGQQMADIARQKAEREKETPEEKAERERKKKELAALALGMANAKSKEFQADADKKGKDGLLAKPVTETLKDSMTVENYDVDVTKFDDKALGSKLNLSSPNAEMGVPKNNKGDAWREQYRTAENAEGKME